MFSYAQKIKGQGVSSSYEELIKAFEKNFKNIFDLSFNSFKRSDISHYHTVNFSFYLSTFFPKKRGTMVGHVHFIPETLEGSLKLPKLILKLFSIYLLSFYKRMDQLVVVNPDFIPKLENLGIKSGKIVYLPNFVSSDNFYEQKIEDRNIFRSNLGIDHNKFVVIGVGQIQTRKGIDDFVSLAKLNPSVQFIWIGDFSFGSLSDGHSKYKKIIKEHPNNLLFTGLIDRKDMVSYYNISDLFLLPSFNELFPMSILEACNCGLPIMLRNLELYEQILKNSYLKSNNLQEMHEVLNSLIHDKNLLKKYKEESKIIANQYSEQAVLKKWFDYYVKCL